MKLGIRSFTRLALVATVVALILPRQSLAAGPAAESQRQLIDILESGAPPQDKAIACKKLAIYGSGEAVPALAPLLADPELASWALIALEAIPYPAADTALRKALEELDGRLLVGVINSIGVRRDDGAVDGLIGKLKAENLQVATAASVALGHIGGDRAAKALKASLAGGSAELRSAMAEGCVLCAEGFLAKGQASSAIALYDAVRDADVPKRRIVEATRGAILARGADGLSLLLEQLRSTDKDMLGIGLRTARELPGRAVTERLAAELENSSPERAVLLLLALADRKDAAVLPAVVAVAEEGPTSLRVVALEVLGRQGDPTSMPVLMNAAIDDYPAVARAAKESLTKLGGREVDAELLARLPQATGDTRIVLIELASLRRIEGSLPTILDWTDDPDRPTRLAAIEAVGVLGGEEASAELVRLLEKTTDRAERTELDQALVAVTGRCGAVCTPHLLPLLRSSDNTLRLIGIHAMASVGGADALKVVVAAVEDPNEVVRDGAVNALATWPNNWPGDTEVAVPLLKLATSGKKLSHQVQGVRGYLRYVQEDDNLTNDQKLAKVAGLLPSVQRPAEKRLAIAVVGTIPTPAALEMLLTFASDEAVAEEAYLAIVNVAGHRSLRNRSTELRQNALRTVVRQSSNAETKKKARELLARN